MEKAFKKPVEILLVLLLSLVIGNSASAAFVVRHASAGRAAAAEAALTPDAHAQVAAKYTDLKTRLTTRDYKLYNFDRPRRVFDMQRRKGNDLAWAGGMCAMAGIAGALISVGFNLEDAVTYSFIGLIVVGAILIAIGVTRMQRSKKKDFAIVSPKSNEMGIAYNF